MNINETQDNDDCRDAVGNIDPFKFAYKEKSKVQPYVPRKYQSCEAENDCEQDEGA